MGLAHLQLPGLFSSCAFRPFLEIVGVHSFNVSRPSAFLRLVILFEYRHRLIMPALTV